MIWLVIGLPLTAAALTALAGTVWWLRRSYITVTVDGPSMLPTYHPGEKLMVRRVAPGALRAGQVVVLDGLPVRRPGGRRPPVPVAQRRPIPVPAPAGVGSGWIVKRVVAVPGDPIPRDSVEALRDEPGSRVPDGHLVLLGDNPERSRDSRQAGYFTADRLVGVVVRRMEADA